MWKHRYKAVIIKPVYSYRSSKSMERLEDPETHP